MQECIQISSKDQLYFQDLENWLLITTWPSFCRTWISPARECYQRQKCCIRTQAHNQYRPLSLSDACEYKWKDPHFIRELSLPRHSSQDQIPLLPLSECWWQLRGAEAWWHSASELRVMLWPDPCTVFVPRLGLKWAKGTRTLGLNFYSLLFL